MTNRSKILIEPKDRYIKQDKPDYLYISLTLIFLIIFIAFAIRPALVTSVKLRKNIATYNSIDEQLTAKIETMRKIRKLYKDIYADLIFIDKAIPDNRDEGTVLNYINYLDKKNGTKTTVVSFSSIEYDESLKLNVLTFNLRVSGKYENVKSYIKDLNNTLRIFDISSVNMVPNTKNGVPDYVSVSIQGRTFYKDNDK